MIFHSTSIEIFNEAVICHLSGEFTTLSQVKLILWVEQLQYGPSKM